MGEGHSNNDGDSIYSVVKKNKKRKNGDISDLGGQESGEEIPRKKMKTKILSGVSDEVFGEGTDKSSRKKKKKKDKSRIDINAQKDDDKREGKIEKDKSNHKGDMKKKKKKKSEKGKGTEFAGADDTIGDADANQIDHRITNAEPVEGQKLKKKKDRKNMNMKGDVDAGFSEVQKVNGGICHGDLVESQMNHGGKEAKKVDDGLIRGKRFSKEEDEIIQNAVYKYIEDHQLGEEGLEMVLHCKSHSKIKDCWREIGQALPQRPYIAVYNRAHILFERSEARKWTPDEIEFVKTYVEKHGPDWKTLAVELGKHRFHVKDAWRRHKFPNLKKGSWSVVEYEKLFNIVNMDLSMKAFTEKKTKHGMLRDNISWDAISEELGTRSNPLCCMKWYNQLTSPMVSEGKWANADDYRLLIALNELDAACEEDVDWDNLLQHRSGDFCRKR